MPRGLLHILLLTFVVPTVVVSLLAQQSDDEPPAFEVVSIKRSVQLDAGGTFRMQPGGLFRSVNLPIEPLILGAYRTSDGVYFGLSLSGHPRG